jgi:nitronate monooxygenase
MSPSSQLSWPERRLTDLLGIEHPLVLAPMAGTGTVALAISVSEAGGLGSLGCAGMSPHQVGQAITTFRARTNKPLNVNFFCHAQAQPDPVRTASWLSALAPFYHEFALDPALASSDFGIQPFNESLCQAVEEYKPEAVSFHFGLPAAPLLTRVKAAGCRVLSSATTVGEARWLEASGVDVVIAQGYEAGGHRATFQTTDLGAVARQPGLFALVPQIVDAVAVPVVAAGGIADARGIAAAFALGASGAQLGTAYLLSPEAATSSIYRDAVRHAQVESSVLTNVFTGRPARAIANRLTADVGPIVRQLPDFPLPMGALAALRAKAEEHESRDFTPFWAGQGAPLARAIPAEKLTRMLAQLALERFRALAR